MNQTATLEKPFTLTIDNPQYEPGNPDSIRTVTVERALREDPLGQMHARHHLGDTDRYGQTDNGPAEARYAAGRAFQAAWERAGRSGRIKSQDTTLEPVDGSRPPARGISQGALDSGKRLDGWKALLGNDGWKLATLVLIDKRTLRECAMLLHITTSPANMKYVGRRFREVLDTLAQSMGMRT